MSAAIAGFAAFASAEVLVRLAVDGGLENQKGHILVPLAVAGLAASLCVLLALAIAAAGSKRSAHARLRGSNDRKR